MDESKWKKDWYYDRIYERARGVLNVEMEKGNYDR
jgi:hypothetical protein